MSKTHRAGCPCVYPESYDTPSDEESSDACTDDWLEMQELQNDLDEEWRTLQEFTQARKLLKEALEDAKVPSSDTPLCLCNSSKSQAAQRGTRCFDLKERMKNVQKQKIPTAIQEHEESEEISDLGPRLLASILHMEEKGLPLDQSPETVYSYLFTEQQDEPLLVTGPAAPFIPKEIVVPLSVPSDSQICQSVHDIGIAASAVSASTNHPRNSVFSENMPNIPERAEEPTQTGDSDQEQQQAGLDFRLQAQPSRNVTQVQIRGSCLPSWFPGYYSVLTTEEKTHISTSPSKIVQKAWKTMDSAGSAVNIISNINF